MSFDTTQQNKLRQSLHDYDEIWLFGYGSLIYKVDFPILAKAPALIKGWQRKFWQGSHDHRGTPEAPGRVLTLIEEGNTECVGMAYQVSQQIFEHLDHREKNGYLRDEVKIHFIHPDKSLNQPIHCKTGLVYIAPKDNSAFLGPASELAIAKQIHQSVGPSGPNRDYVFHLADALRNLQAEDEHVFMIEKYLKAMS